MFAKGVAVLFLGLYSTQLMAAEAVIFDSRRPIALSDQEQPPRDYYVNAGSELGLKPGVLVTVVRRLAVYDFLANKSAGELLVHIAKVKVLHVQPGLSVVRLRSYFSGQQEVSLDDHFIMIGDQLDVSTAEVDHGEKSAAIEGKESTESASTAPSEPAPSAAITVAANATVMTKPIDESQAQRPPQVGASAPKPQVPQPAVPVEPSR
jgi:hypothetical protein